ncbi:MAG: cyclase family protein [Chlamydiota bacterium]
MSIELTHPLSSHIPTWNGSCGFSAVIKKDYDKMFRVQKIEMHAGIGTHMDAPSHRFEGMGSIADIPLETLVVPACVIDVRKKAHADYEISLEDIKAYEHQHGKIPQKSLVLGFTGWSRFWNEPKAYRNEDDNGQMHFPAFSEEAALLLLEREIAGLGIDTFSPDCLDLSYPVHRHILGSGKYIIENIADCSLMPPSHAYAIALPLRAVDCTECPIRLIGVPSGTFPEKKDDLNRKT